MKAHCGQGLRIIVTAGLLIGATHRCVQAQEETPAGKSNVLTPQTSANTAQIVLSDRIVAEDGRVLSDTPAGLPISIGKPVDRDQVAESIRALYRTGDYADVRAVSTAVEGGVRIDFVVREQLYFNAVL